MIAIAARGIFAAVTSVAMMATSAPAWAQADFPSQPVKMTVGNTAGSASDNLARVLAGRLSQTLGQQVLVVNQPGAGGTIAAEAVARSAPDGYSLYVTSTQSHSIAPHIYLKAKYKPDDFVAVTMVAKTENILVVPTASRVAASIPYSPAPFEIQRVAVASPALRVTTSTSSATMKLA